MKRLVGGDYLLDLSPIEIEESVDDETYTSITDKSVLDQLTGLKAFIGKSGMIKPIWVKLLNGETDEIVATRGSLSTSDGVTFLIKVLLAGFILTLSVEFTQAETEDHTPLDEWYIDDNDAKYILVSEAQAIGNIEELPVFENIVDKDGHKRFVEGNGTIPDSLPEGISITYAKWSLSGTHLMIVCAGSASNEAVFPNDSIVRFTLPAWIHDKIFVQYSAYADTKSVVMYGENYTTQSLSTYLRKRTNNEISINTTTVTLTADRKFRIQYDLLIDNEETETPAP